MRRILFVHDQQEVLDAHRESLKKYSGQVETMFALGVDAALELARSVSIDVVVADLHMRHMDGPTLLRKMKEEHPDIIRLILCGQQEFDSIFVALPTAHQIIASPLRSEERRVGKECRSRWSPYH